MVPSGRADRPWFFASTGSKRPAKVAGRFDLPEPLGACYTALSAVACVLEVLADHLPVLPVSELAARRRIEVVAPPDVPPAANLGSKSAAGAGVTAALWAGSDRALTQEWAAALHAAGWKALQHPIQHDPSGGELAVTFLGDTGEHGPTPHPGWADATVHTLHDDHGLRAELAGFEIGVVDDTSLLVVPFTP